MRINATVRDLKPGESAYEVAGGHGVWWSREQGEYVLTRWFDEDSLTDLVTNLIEACPDRIAHHTWLDSTRLEVDLSELMQYFTEQSVAEDGHCIPLVWKGAYHINHGRPGVLHWIATPTGNREKYRCCQDVRTYLLDSDPNEENDFIDRDEYTVEIDEDTPFRGPVATEDAGGGA